MADCVFAAQYERVEPTALGNRFSAERNDVIKHRLRIAQAALCAACDRVCGRSLQRDLLFLRDELQVLRDQNCRDTMQIESLATAKDGWQNFLRLSRSKNKFHMVWRLFQRLQKCVECG